MNFPVTFWISGILLSHASLHPAFSNLEILARSFAICIPSGLRCRLSGVPIVFLLRGICVQMSSLMGSRRSTVLQINCLFDCKVGNDAVFSFLQLMWKTYEQVPQYIITLFIYVAYAPGLYIWAERDAVPTLIFSLINSFKISGQSLIVLFNCFNTSLRQLLRDTFSNIWVREGNLSFKHQKNMGPMAGLLLESIHLESISHLAEYPFFHF